jgi:hypothetical protein
MTNWTVENDPEVQAYVRGQSLAADEASNEQLVADIKQRRQAREHPYLDFVRNLPKNIGIGGYKGLVETIDSAPEVGAILGAASGNPIAAASAVAGASKPEGEEAGLWDAVPLSERFPEFMGSVSGFTESWERNDRMSDDVVQGITQFTLPFMGWLKAAGGVSGATKLAKVGKAAAAEAATAATAFDPHDGRFADLAKLGRESDTNFGNLLRTVAPDDSLTNQYIDYMTSREDEGALEGRFKNAVDATISSAFVAGLIKTAATTRKGLQYSMDNAAASSGGKGVPNQLGMVAFHGTPHDFDAFDLSKLGTGEGHQAFGHGLYFAEAEGTAKHYRGALSRRGITPGSAMDNAMTAMEKANWDAKQAYASLMRTASSARDSEYRETLIKAADKIKAGNVKQLGKLMTVDIPDEAVAKMLDFDTPLRNQPNILKRIPAEDRAKLEAMLEENDHVGDLEEYTGNQLQQMIGRAISEDRIAFNPKDGNFDNTKKLAAEYFLANDIPGIRFLDGNSRSKSAGTRNIVLFDDKLVTITKKE